MRRKFAAALALGLSSACCSAASDEHATDEPTEGSPSVGDEGLPQTGCRYSERVLQPGESIDGWPSPAALAATLADDYVGQMTWHDDSEGGAAEILLRVEVDPNLVRLRYPTALPRPGEPRICTATLNFPVKVWMRLGTAETEFEGTYLAFNRLLELSADLDPSFASSFSSEYADAYRVFIDVRLDGTVAAGKIELSKRGVIRRVEAVFVSHKKPSSEGMR